MTRILADLPDEDIERLDRIAREQFIPSGE